MSTVVYVPRDAGALALGAERVAQAIAAQARISGVPVTIKRNGSRGLYWLEPMVEVETAQGRVAYGPVRPEEVAGLFAANFLAGQAHPLHLGPIGQHPYLVRQTRVTFAGRHHPAHQHQRLPGARRLPGSQARTGDAAR